MIGAPRWPAFSGATTQSPAFREASPVFLVEPHPVPAVTDTNACFRGEVQSVLGGWG